MVNIHVRHSDTNSLLHALLGQHLVYTCLATRLHPLLFAMGRFTVIIRSQQLAVGHSQYRFTRNSGSVHVVGQELELAIQPFLLLQAIEIINGKRHFLITFPLPKITFIRRIIIPMFYHFPHELHCRIILLPVTLALGLNHHLVQRISSRSKRNHYTSSACRMNQPGVFLIAHSRNHQPGLRTIGFKRKNTLVIGHSSLCGSL